MQIPELVTPLGHNSPRIFKESNNDEKTANGRQVRFEGLRVNFNVVFDLSRNSAKLRKCTVRVAGICRAEAAAAACQAAVAVLWRNGGVATTISVVVGGPGNVDAGSHYGLSVCLSFVVEPVDDDDDDRGRDLVKRKKVGVTSALRLGRARRGTLP